MNVAQGRNPAAFSELLVLAEESKSYASPVRDAAVDSSAHSDLAKPALPGQELRRLCKAIRKGEEAAFSEFYAHYSLRLYKFLLVIARGNDTEAREVLQTLVLKLASRFQVFDDESRLWAWLCGCARNAYVDLCRAKKRQQRFVPLEHHEADMAEAGREEHRLSASLQRAMECLGPEEQELLRAAYVDERPLQELANEAGQTYKALESRLGRLRGKLKAFLLNDLKYDKQS